MSKQGESSSGGIGLCGATFIVFLILKLCHVIDWSWWWVTAPLWIPPSIILACVAFALVFSGVVAAGAALLAWLWKD